MLGGKGVCSRSKVGTRVGSVKGLMEVSLVGVVLRAVVVFWLEGGGGWSDMLKGVRVGIEGVRGVVGV